MKTKPFLYEDARAYGFDWPNEDSHLQVTRAIAHKGYRVLDIRTDRQVLQVQITPTGLIRAFGPWKNVGREGTQMVFEGSLMEVKP